MSIGYWVFLLVALFFRALFYSLSIKRTIVSYVVLAVIYIGTFFTLFGSDTIMAVTFPGIVLIIMLFLWVFETHVIGNGRVEKARDVKPDKLVGLVVQALAFAFVFASARTPHLREYLIPLGNFFPKRLIIIVIGGFVATFELDHLLRRPVDLPSRLLAYLFWMHGVLLASALVAIGSITVLTVLTEERNRIYQFRKSTVSIALALLVGAIVRRALRV